jgi:flagellar basal-body rod modification protein FlgD
MTTLDATAATAAPNTSVNGLAIANAMPGADFNMFLKLLTVQMQNQDPLDPMKTSEYTQQLAQYSQVEQTVQQTSTLKNILAQLSTQEMAQASGFIGKDGTFNSPVSGLSSISANWNYTPGAAAESLTASISDASGKIVDTRKIDGAAPGSFTWDGKLPDGTRAANGPYSLSIAAIDANGAAVPVTVGSAGRITDVTSVGGAISLGVNGIWLPASALVKVSAIA